jgi:prepilin signal peptidase PulO-like enzyme (type II secretory pathway)
MNYLAVDIKQQFFGGISTTPNDPTQIGPFITNLLSNALILAGLLLLVFMIVAGIGIIGNAGSENPERLEKMKKAIMSAIIGFIVVFCAYWIVQLISKVTGVDIIP